MSDETHGVERLTAAELVYHRECHTALADAQAGLLAAQERFKAAQGAWGSWAAYLVRAHRIGPADVVHESGVIERPGGGLDAAGERA